MPGREEKKESSREMAIPPLTRRILISHHLNIFTSNLYCYALRFAQIAITIRKARITAHKSYYFFAFKTRSAFFICDAGIQKIKKWCSFSIRPFISCEWLKTLTNCTINEGLKTNRYTTYLNATVAHVSLAAVT